MNSVIYLKARTDPSIAPCFVLADLQQGYIAGPQFLAMSAAESALANCRAALQHARAMGFPVAYLRQISQSPFFNPITDFFNWIVGFEPTAADMVFDRDKPSCYSSKHFSDLMASCQGHFVLAGFAGETACLSTAIDAYHRDHHFTFLTDASVSHELEGLSADIVQKTVTQIIGVYGDIIDTSSWIAMTSNSATRSANGWR
jgi:nicotinamidase-related amidase